MSGFETRYLSSHFETTAKHACGSNRTFGVGIALVITCNGSQCRMESGDREPMAGWIGTEKHRSGQLESWESEPGRKISSGQTKRNAIKRNAAFRASLNAHFIAPSDSSAQRRTPPRYSRSADPSGPGFSYGTGQAV